MIAPSRPATRGCFTSLGSVVTFCFGALSTGFGEESHAARGNTRAREVRGRPAAQREDRDSGRRAGGASRAGVGGVGARSAPSPGCVSGAAAASERAVLTGRRQ